MFTQKKKLYLIEKMTIVYVLREDLAKNAHYRANMLVPGRLLAMICLEIAIFDLTDRFYGMKNVIYESLNRL